MKKGEGMDRQEIQKTFFRITNKQPHPSVSAAEVIAEEQSKAVKSGNPDGECGKQQLINNLKKLSNNARFIRKKDRNDFRIRGRR